MNCTADKQSINLNNSIKKELPFSENDILNILKIVDVALADEKIEKEIQNWMENLHESISFEELESLHKKVNIFLQTKNKILNNPFGFTV